MRLFAIAMAIAILLAPAAAHAQRAAAPAGEAARLKKEGDEAFLALRYADALRAYDAAYDLAASPALQYNRGRALEALERYADAIDAYERFLKEAPAELRERTAKLGEHVKTLKQRVATLDLRVTPAGARILVRKVAVGKAPLSVPLRVNAGAALLEVEAEEHHPFARELSLAGGSNQTLVVDLKPRGARLSLSSTPAGAAFFVDGRAIEGTTASVAPGSHVVRAVLGDKSAERKVEAREGEQMDLTLELSRPSLLSRWWFWTAAGAVVVGAGVTTFVLINQSPEPRNGDIGSGRMTVP